MAIIKLPAETRENAGSRASEALRKSGYIPANLYAHGEQSTLLKLQASIWKKALTEELHLVNLELPDGKIQLAAVKEVQRATMDQEVIHLDLQGVRMDQPIEIQVKVEFHGNPVGEKAGGVRSIITDHIMIKALPAKVPDHLHLDITKLEAGHSLHAKDIELPEGVELVADPETPVISVVTTRMTVEEEAPAETEGEGAEAEE